MFQDRTLREAYQPYFPVGTAVNKYFTRDQKKANFIAKQYASVTSEDQLKPFVVQPSQHKFVWKDADSLVAFAQRNNMLVRGHCLVWEKRMPTWFYKDQNGLVSKDTLLKRLETHINKVVSRYKGKIYCWDVVNEAISWDSGEVFRATDTLYNVLGYEYIKKSFEFAHTADPKALLFYNDEGFNSVVKRDKIYNLVKRLKSDGVPIDGIGMQCHLGINGMNEQVLRYNIERFKKLGLQVQITELDVSIYDKYDKVKLMGVSEDYTSSIQEKQSRVYETIFRVSREYKGTVTGITLWGSADGVNFLTIALNKKNYPYLFDSTLRPKRVFYKITNF